MFSGGNLYPIIRGTIFYSYNLAIAFLLQLFNQVLAATLTLSQPGCRIMPTLYWRPHQVLKATGAPDVPIYQCLKTVNFFRSNTSQS